MERVAIIKSEIMDIFGYKFEEILAMQQKKPLNKKIDTSVPSTNDATHYESDMFLLKKYGEKKLREMEYMGVIDRLERGGHLNE